MEVKEQLMGVSSLPASRVFRLLDLTASTFTSWAILQAHPSWKLRHMTSIVRLLSGERYHLTLFTWLSFIVMSPWFQNKAVNMFWAGHPLFCDISWGHLNKYLLIKKCQIKVTIPPELKLSNQCIYGGFLREDEWGLLHSVCAHKLGPGMWVFSRS